MKIGKIFNNISSRQQIESMLFYAGKEIIFHIYAYIICVYAYTWIKLDLSHAACVVSVPAQHLCLYLHSL